MNNGFVDYLNTLHNYNAQNPNAYGESNFESKYFNDTVVEVGLCKFIENKIKTEAAQVIILTGHAGDGKTSIMYNVLSSLGGAFDSSKPIFDVQFGSKKVHCIKDFSEISDGEKSSVLNEALEMPNSGDFTFMVANTGPLINTFKSLFISVDEGEAAQIQLIDEMDRNSGIAKSIGGYNICIINVAAVDNTYFAKEFLKNVIKDELWQDCANCPKKDYCHIYSNRCLIKTNQSKVFDFISKHYIWLTEHGKRLTIRSMTEQISYMISGGASCADIKKDRRFDYLFSNLFFGYVKTYRDPKALNILAIKELSNVGYDSKRLRSDEILLINREYSSLFDPDVANLLSAAENDSAFEPGWAEALRRAYFFLNIVMDEKTLSNDMEDVFSKQFARFLGMRDGSSSPTKSDVNLICDALSMIYIGTTKVNDRIPLTLSRNSGITQNVQLITGMLDNRDIKLVLEPTKDNVFDNNRVKYEIRLVIKKQKLSNIISLPLLDYFEELKNGIISTNIDPQLSHGVESLKAELAALFSDDDDTFEMIILKNSGNETVELEITSNNRIQVI